MSLAPSTSSAIENVQFGESYRNNENNSEDMFDSNLIIENIGQNSNGKFIKILIY